MILSRNNENYLKLILVIRYYRALHIKVSTEGNYEIIYVHTSLLEPSRAFMFERKFQQRMTNPLITKNVLIKTCIVTMHVCIGMSLVIRDTFHSIYIPKTDKSPAGVPSPLFPNSYVKLSAVLVLLQS